MFGLIKKKKNHVDKWAEQVRHGSRSEFIGREADYDYRLEMAARRGKLDSCTLARLPLDAQDLIEGLARQEKVTIPADEAAGLLEISIMPQGHLLEMMDVVGDDLPADQAEKLRSMSAEELRGGLCRAVYDRYS